MKIARSLPNSRATVSDSFASSRAATELAIRALAFLALDVERVERFFNLTGLDPADIRGLAGEVGFQLAVLDHLASDESLLIAFVQQEGLPPEAIGRARRALGGGEP